MNPVLPIVSMITVVAATSDANFQSVIDEYRESQDIPGISAVVIRANDVIFSGASGMANLATNREMTANTVFYIGSLTKVLTAVLTLNLIEADKLSLADTVDMIAADVGDAAIAVSVSHLLTHSSGLPREGNFDYWFTADFPDQRDLGDYLRTAELDFSPGTDRQYSNIAYAALGPVIENASGQSYSDALRTRVLEPLRMRTAGSPGPADDVAIGYSPPGRLIPSEERPFAGVGEKTGDRHVRMYHDAGAMTPAFGAYASALDLGRLARFLLDYGGDDVLSKNMRAQMRNRQANGWGLGLKVQRYKGHRVARHDGWFAAHRSHMILDVRDGIAVVVLTNGDNANPTEIAEALFDAALETDSMAE
ncbi:MAG: beta-lactamase family protein [Proteobacteria bacterium]|nr:beta-lactamase family protein [Pseudomonadota bacterium]